MSSPAAHYRSGFRRDGRCCAGLLGGLALFLAAAAPAAVELEVSVGLGGHARLGAWTPVRVVVNNKGEATRGELVIPPQPATDPFSDYRVAVEVPPSSSRAFEMYARLRIAAASLDVEFRPERGPVTLVHATCNAHEPRSRIVLVISRKAGGLGTIGVVPIRRNLSASEDYSPAESVVGYVTPDRTTGALGLPDRPAGYEGLSAVVLRDISPADFEDAERDALVRWVESGGLLVVMSAPNVAELRDSFIEKLCPVRIRGQRVLPHLGALAEHFRANLNYGRALVADSEPKPGADVIVSQAGLPLLARHHYASGTVCFLAADCAAPPLESADALVGEMWSDILEDEHFVDQWAPFARLQPPGDPRAPSGLSPALVQLPILEWEAFALFGGYLLVYIAILVVVNVLLKRLDRREWTGHATVVAIAVFSLGALYLGTSPRLAACRTYDAAVAGVRSGSSVAWLEGVSGVRSPAARKLEISAAADGQTIEYVCGARRAVSWPIHEQGSFTLRRLPIDLWGFGAARVQGPWDLGGRVTVRLIAVDEQRLAVSIENATPYDLRWPFVLLPGSLRTMSGTIPAGSTRETDPFERSALQWTPPPPSSGPEVTHSPSLYQALVEHCKAEDSVTAPSAQVRIRHRLLRQLGSDEEPSYSYSFWSLPSGPPSWGNQPNPFLSERPLFGAWIELSTPLTQVSPAPGSHVSQVLLFVDVPLDLSLPEPGVRRFSELLPSIDTSSSGIGLSYDGKIQVSTGTHELHFRLPAHFGPRRTNSLVVDVGTDVPGVVAEVYNYRSRQWEKLAVAANTQRRTELSPPEDYVRWPWVKVRLSQHQARQATITCTLSGELGQY